MDHPESGFFSFILRPRDGNTLFNYLLVTRGTSHKLPPGYASGLFTMDLDGKGIAYQYAMWDSFKSTMLQVLSNYDASFTLVGHSLGGILSARILEILYHHNIIKYRHIRQIASDYAIYWVPVYITVCKI
jgi:hypothetical protein